MNIIEKYGIQALHELVGAYMYRPVRECFAEGLSRLLKKNGISQVQLAKKLGVNQGTVSRWVNGKEVPHAPVVDSIAEFFDVHPSLLFSPQINVESALSITNGQVTINIEKIVQEMGYSIKKRDS